MLLGWAHVGAAAAASAAVVLVAAAFVWRCCCHNHRLIGPERRFKLQSQSESGVGLDHGKKGNYPVFGWGDHPNLASEAVENGWAGFGFSGQVGSSPLAVFEVEMGWEVCDGSVELMQKIEVRKGNGCVVVRTALPLPGPAGSFPQESYFEVTVLSCGGEGEAKPGRVRESEWAKLIQQNEVGNDDDITSSEFEASVGLTGGGCVPGKVPGTYPASIGFNSNGSVFLDGTKLVFESEKSEWGRKDQVIGCGFDLRNKKVFFTVDSQLVHVFHCQREEFGTPLYPTLAANADITILINFGQSAFKYEPANAHRTPNPCFTSPAATSLASALGYDDSRELFSMGSHWFNRPNTNKANNGQLGQDVDAEVETEFFEIVLDGSPKT